MLAWTQKTGLCSGAVQSVISVGHFPYLLREVGLAQRFPPVLLEPQGFLGAAVGAARGWGRRGQVPSRQLGTISTGAALSVPVLCTGLLGEFQVSSGIGGGEQGWEPLVPAAAVSL